MQGFRCSPDLGLPGQGLVWRAPLTVHRQEGDPAAELGGQASKHRLHGLAGATPVVMFAVCTSISELVGQKLSSMAFETTPVGVRKADPSPCADITKLETLVDLM